MNRRLSIFFLFLLLQIVSHGQSWFLELSSRVELRTWKLTTKSEKNEDGIGGALVTLSQNDKTIKQINTDPNGDFIIQIPPNGEFILTISYKDCVPKKVIISTKGVPPDVGEDNYRPSYPMYGVIMAKPFPGVDYSSIKQPIVKVQYFPNGRVFDKDESYTDHMFAVLKKIADAENTLIEKFCSTNRDGDKALAKPDCPKAKELYNQAIALIPGENYPVEQLKKVGDCLNAKEAEEKAKAEAEAKAKAAAEAKAKAEQEALAKKEAETKAKAEAEAKAKAEAEAKAKVEAENKAKAEQEALAKKESEAKAKAEAENKSKAEAEAKAKAEAENKAKAEQEALAKKNSEAKAKAEAENKSKAEAEAKAKAEQEALAKKQGEEAKAKTEAENKAKAEAEAKAKAEQEALAKKEAEAKAKAETKVAPEVKVDPKVEAEAKAKAEADAKALAEKAAADKAAADKALADKAAADKALADKAAAERAAAKIAKEKELADKAAAAKQAKEKAAADKALADKAAKEKALADKAAPTPTQAVAMNTPTSKPEETKTTTTVTPYVQPPDGVIKGTYAPESGEVQVNAKKVEVAVPQTVIGGSKYKELIKRGDELMKMKRYAEAKPVFEDALKAKPDDAYAKSKLEAIAKLLTP